MNTVQIIKKKRDGQVLNREELRFLVEGFTSGEIPDYALWPGGGPCATKIFYKFLRA